MMKTTVCGTLVLGMLAGCGGSASDSADTATSAKLQERIKSVETCLAWQTGGTYFPGEIVGYNGAYYMALVQQTDYAGTGWNPSIPTLFAPGAACGFPPTPTPAPVPCPAAWSATTLYEPGNQVADKIVDGGGLVFVANVANEGDNPDAEYTGGSTDPWNWTGLYCGTARAPIPTPSPSAMPEPTRTPTTGG
jgi:chitinase